MVIQLVLFPSTRLGLITYDSIPSLLRALTKNGAHSKTELNVFGLSKDQGVFALKLGLLSQTSACS